MSDATDDLDTKPYSANGHFADAYDQSTPKVEPPKDDLRDKIEEIQTDYMKGYWAASANDSLTELKQNDKRHIKKLEALIKLQQEALLAKLEAELPKKRPDVKPINSRTLDGIADANYNTALKQVKKTINKLRLEL